MSSVMEGHEAYSYIHLLSVVTSLYAAGGAGDVLHGHDAVQLQTVGRPIYRKRLEEGAD